jgi:hypothetical protein
VALSLCSVTSVGAAGAGSAVWGARAGLTGPITAGTIVEPESAHSSGLSSAGYLEQEFFASGRAYAFRALSTPSDGRWSIAPSTSASYRTRIIVRRPAQRSRFNGTVVVEWMNVTGGESAPDWDFLNPMLMREGYAYVGVSAQALGVNGGAPLLGIPGTSPNGGLVHQEPARYGTLHHPGDQYALDIYGQIGASLRAGGAVLGGLRPRHVVAVGESQSAFYLTTFVNALQPRTHTFDGFFIHSRGGGAASLTGGSVSSAISGAQRIRTDLRIPVFMFETQTDLIQLGYAAAQQPNTAHIRTWEVAGTSHADSYVVGSYASYLGCAAPINDGPQHIVVQAAFDAFGRWVARGTPPPAPAPFRLMSRNPAVLALDSHGNVVGGVRTPAVDVPVSTLSGAPAPGSSPICGLFGSTTAFSPAQLRSIYGSKSGYLRAYQADLSRSIEAGYILPADRASLLAQAEQVGIPT